MTRNASGKIASGSAKVDQYSFVYRDLGTGVFTQGNAYFTTPDPFSRASPLPPPPLTCLPLVRIFSNKSHADEKSTMAVAHKETRVFTMSSRCIETMSLKIHGNFFFLSLFLLLLLSLSFFFSRQGAIPHSLRLRIFFFFFLEGFYLNTFCHAFIRFYLEALNRSSSCLLIFFLFFFFARAR